METNTIFVLGIVCGLALVGLVYLIIAVLKMRKEIKGLQNYISNHERDYNNSISSTYSEIKDRSNEIHKRIDDFIERDYTVATTALENEILNNLFGQYGEDIPPIVIRYLRKLPRKTLLNRLVRVGLIDKDLLKGSETIEEQGGNAPDMDVSGMDSAYDFVSDGPMAGGDVYPTEGEMEEQISPEQIMYYKRRGIVYSNILSFIEAAKGDFDMCHDFGDEFEYGDNIISSALSDFFVQIGEELDSDFYYEVYDLCKDWFGEDLITEYMEECGGQEEEEEEDFMFMESAFADEIDEVDVSGSQGIYGEMDPPYDFDSEGPGKAGPYQRSSYNEEEVEDEKEVEDEEEFEIDEDLQESFHNQKNKITEMMSRMKIIK